MLSGHPTRSLELAPHRVRGPYAFVAADIVRFGVAHGGREEDLIAVLGDSRARIEQPLAAVPKEDMANLWAATSSLCEDRNAATLLGQCSTTTYAAFRSLGSDTSNPHDLLQAVTAGFPRITNGLRLSVQPEGARVGITVSCAHELDGEPIELLFTILCRLLFGGRSDAGVDELHFRHDPIGRLSDYRAAFGTTPRFGAPNSKLWVDSRSVTRAKPLPTDPLGPYLWSAELRNPTGERTNLRRRVLQATEANANHGLFDLDSLAARLHLGVRTLQRHSTADGISLRDLIARVRLRRAKTLLANPQLSIQYIGSQLGYSCERSFSRAFKAQTTYTPAAWRRR